MRTAVNLVGKRFGRLVVVARAENEKNKQPRWDCVCDCGKTHTVNRGGLKSGNVKSCGCYRSEASRERQTGKLASIETRNKLSKMRKASGNSNWRGGISLEKRGLRHSLHNQLKYAIWR